MNDFLVYAPWGYQTCEGPEGTIGRFRPGSNNMRFYKEPGYGEMWPLRLYQPHENWKLNYASDTGQPMSELHKMFRFMYTYPGIDCGIDTTNTLYGYEEVLDIDNRITWIKVSEDYDVWGPFNEYEEPVRRNPYKCSLCKKTGHNKRTCVKRIQLKLN